MHIFRTVADLQIWLDAQRALGRKVGFAPTMGALHEGHLSLIELAKSDDTVAVASIFVNPTQFNDPGDLEKYPRMPERDIELLASAQCDALFMPSVEEVYPPGRDLTLRIEFGSLDKVMEGIFRPGHFSGMATVVKRLLDIVQPQRLYMGQKDYQQLSIVRDMIRQLQLSVELVMCPTVREADGLAMSSRNMRLSPEMRAISPAIYQALEAARAELPATAAGVVQARAMERLEAASLRPEYFDIVDGVSLQPIVFWSDSNFIVACTAAFAGEVRLIDNMVLKHEVTAPDAARKNL